MRVQAAHQFLWVCDKVGVWGKQINNRRRCPIKLFYGQPRFLEDEIHHKEGVDQLSYSMDNQGFHKI